MGVGTPAVMVRPGVAVYVAAAVYMVRSRMDWRGGFDACGVHE